MGMKGQSVIRHRSLRIPAISHKFLSSIFENVPKKAFY